MSFAGFGSLSNLVEKLGLVWLVEDLFRKIVFLDTFGQSVLKFG